MPEASVAPAIAVKSNLIRMPLVEDVGLLKGPSHQPYAYELRFRSPYDEPPMVDGFSAHLERAKLLARSRGR